MSSIDMRTTGKLTRQLKAASICRFATPPFPVATARRCHFGGKERQRRQWAKLVCKLLSYRMTTAIDNQDIGSTAANFNSVG
jgi:hypothetical protein